ncbi:hypothetical protein D3C84_574480 [compost metagenome]
MRTNYVLIDYENVQVQSLELLQQPHFKIRVFLGPNNTKLPTELAVAIQRFGDRADYIQLDTPGQNALDFHVAYYLGRLAAEDQDAFFHIISRDKGFDPLLKHLKGKSVFAVRSETIEGMRKGWKPTWARPTRSTGGLDAQHDSAVRRTSPDLGACWENGSTRYTVAREKFSLQSCLWPPSTATKTGKSKSTRTTMRRRTSMCKRPTASRWWSSMGSKFSAKVPSPGP